MIELIRNRISAHQPKLLDPEHDQREKAAVLMPLIDEAGAPRVLLTERAGSLSTHGGEVAFPGGRADQTDPYLEYTALRENEEELGIRPDSVQVLGTLRPFISKYGLHVTPFVGLLPPAVPVVPNPDEIASVFEVPLDWFVATAPVRIDDLTRHGEQLLVPAWEYDGYEIWGLTAMIISEFLSVTRDG